MTSSLQWQKSSFSGAGGENCVQLAAAAGTVLLRESDAPRAIVTASPAALRRLLVEIKAGEFDHFTG